MSNGYNFYDNAPRGYTLCLSAGCASADHCLRQLAARHLSRAPMSVSVANPLLTDTKGEGACQFFRKAEKVRVAYGFKQAMSRIESGKVARELESGIMEIRQVRDELTEIHRNITAL